MATQLVSWSECPFGGSHPRPGRRPAAADERGFAARLLGALEVAAITSNYDAFHDTGLSPDAVIAETPDRCPEAMKPKPVRFR